MELKLGDVEETALIPLAVRANETRRKNARIRDEKAVEIIETIGIDPKPMDKFITHEGVVARTILFDGAVKSLLKQYPDAVCLNIGCGLDDRFSRVDNGTVRWFNIDLPDSIEVRRKTFSETERERMLGADILSDGWTEQIPKARVTIVIAEGILMYFSKEQTKSLLNNLTAFSGEGFLLAELMHPKMMNEKMHDTVKRTNAKFGWGTTSGEELCALEPRLTLMRETSFWEEAKKHTVFGKLGSVFAKNLNNRLAVYRWR